MAVRHITGLFAGWIAVAAAQTNQTAVLPPSFRNDVVPVLTKLGCNSGACHGSQYGKGGFKLSLLGFDADADYDAIVKDVRGRRINLASLSESLILQKPTVAMPHGGGLRFQNGSPQYNLILSWLAAGALPPTPADPMLVNVAVANPSLVMRTREQRQLKVTASFSDGSQRDVTGMSRLEVINESIAEVSAAGIVTGKSGGATAALARYMGRTAVINVMIPFAPPANLTTWRNNNYIDELLANKWRSMGIPPARDSSDTQFARRVYFDLIGVPPTEQEVRAFIGDTSRGKRQALIDRLLERPEYIDFWTLRWGDILRVTRAGMGEKAMWNFHRWLRRAIASNQPINEMIGEILASRGQPNSQGTAAFYRMARTPEDLAETVSVTFMGLRLGCAKCHQHPFEKWGQDDYYGLAAFFARIDSKPDADYAAASLRIKPAGYVRHPKTQQIVRPAVPDGATYDYDDDPRLKLAAWLASKDNPWVARNFVNRFWGYMMGRGLIEPLDDIRDTNPPIHPELLAELIKDFKQHGFDQKHILRRIANSRAYQLDSAPAAGSPGDPAFYAYYTPRRLLAEQLLEAVNRATNVPDKFSNLPKNIRPLQLPDPEVPSYFLDTFGRSKRQVPCECSRGDDSNITQALHLINSDYLEAKLSAPSGRIASLFSLVPIDQIVPNLYFAALQRPPSAAELAKAAGLVNSRGSDESRRKALEDLLWALLNSREFLFNH